ncbi:hypothetical protein MHB42_20130 [Lysinibacillus sp. FSL K6-0232]|uniref:hypothetical protein n=1 Tax=unclassified Lysinibacillus TaxID=2636778 RepID=UPI0030F5712A
MSNMKTNRNSAKVNGTRSASKSNRHQKLQQEEFGSEFELDSALAQVNNFAESRGKTGTQQPVSERTAWH